MLHVRLQHLAHAPGLLGAELGQGGIHAALQAALTVELGLAVADEEDQDGASADVGNWLLTATAPPVIRAGGTGSGQAGFCWRPRELAP